MARVIAQTKSQQKRTSANVDGQPNREKMPHHPFLPKTARFCRFFLFLSPPDKISSAKGSKTVDCFCKKGATVMSKIVVLRINREQGLVIDSAQATGDQLSAKIVELMRQRFSLT
jgi:hypothetical protein